MNFQKRNALARRCLPAKTVCMNLLLSGDLHLGRSSSRLPAEWSDEARAVSAWERLVAFALREKIDVLLLSGDLIDQSNRFFESIGPLERGLRSLGEAGIRSVAVSGNHDADTLPLLARRLPPETFHLLGEGGHWETLVLEHAGRPALRLVGWSFPQSQVHHDPVAHFPAPPADGLPTLALVHGDPDVRASAYAPLSSARLRAQPVHGWLLGHIHKPSLSPGEPWILMPGSPQGLDPSEDGPHHAWTCSVSPGGLSLPQPACPAALGYSSLDLRLAPSDIPNELLLLERLQAARLQPPFPGKTSLRLRLSGETRDPDTLHRVLASLPDWRDAHCAIESIDNQVRPVLDLDACRRAGPVPALLADALDAPPPELLDRLRDLCERLNLQREYEALPPLRPADIPLDSLLRSLLHSLQEDPA